MDDEGWRGWLKELALDLLRIWAAAVVLVAIVRRIYRA